MTNVEIDGVQQTACEADQWVLSYEPSPLKLRVIEHLVFTAAVGTFGVNTISTDLYVQEVFDTEAEITTRVEALGFEMP